MKVLLCPLCHQARDAAMVGDCSLMADDALALSLSFMAGGGEKSLLLSTSPVILSIFYRASDNDRRCQPTRRSNSS